MDKTSPEDSRLLPGEGESLAILLDGNLRILQQEKGYRFSIDALLLAHFVRLKDNASVLELGTGSGVIAIILARRWRCMRVTGVEIQEEMADLARRNVLVNGLKSRVEIICRDVRGLSGVMQECSCDAVVFNPPYRRLQSGRINDNRQRALARHEILGSIQDFLNAAARVLKTKGSVSLIYPASRTVELMVRMRAVHLEPKRLRPVYSHHDAKGTFVLVEGIKGGGEALHILPPLVIYGEDGFYTQAVQMIFNDLSVPLSGGDD